VEKRSTEMVMEEHRVKWKSTNPGGRVLMGIEEHQSWCGGPKIVDKECGMISWSHNPVGGVLVAIEEIPSQPQEKCQKGGLQSAEGHQRAPILAEHPCWGVRSVYPSDGTPKDGELRVE